MASAIPVPACGCAGAHTAAKPAAGASAAAFPVPAPDSKLTFSAIPLPATASEVDFGVIAEGVDLGHLSDADFASLREAVYRHHVVVVRGQSALTPPQQLALTHRFDGAATEYGHGSNMELMKASVLTNDLVNLPSAPEVKLLGNGPVAEHDGLKDLTLKHPMHFSFHKDTLPADDYAHTRFYRWHIDAALYGKNPPHVTTLLALETPEGAPQVVRYDDGSGDELLVPLATTAFISGERAFAALSPAKKAWALQTRVRYHAHPYIWIKNCKALSTGLGLVSEGKEIPDAELPPWDEFQIKILPAVWRNPVTGALALQIHPCCVEDLIVAGKPVGDLAEVRRILTELLRPGIAPARVLAHDWLPGDCVLFNNRGVTHTVTGTLKPTDVRVYHQCNMAASDPVVGPSEEEIDAVLAAAGVTREAAAGAFDAPAAAPAAARGCACAAASGACECKECACTDCSCGASAGAPGSA